MSAQGMQNRCKIAVYFQFLFVNLLPSSEKITIPRYDNLVASLEQFQEVWLAIPPFTILHI